MAKIIRTHGIVMLMRNAPRGPHVSRKKFWLTAFICRDECDRGLARTTNNSNNDFVVEYNLRSSSSSRYI